MYQEDSEYMYFGVVLSTANPSPVPENSTVESRNLNEQANHLNFSSLLSIARPVVSRENNVTSTDERTLLSSIIVLGDEGMNQGKEMACVYVCAWERKRWNKVNTNPGDFFAQADVCVYDLPLSHVR